MVVRLQSNAMYAVADGAYCYPQSKVLKNRAGLKRQSALDKFELAMVTQRFDEPLPNGRLSVTHYRAIHHHLFQDVYDWAGNFRTIRLSKGTSQFCYPENISAQLKKLFAEKLDMKLLSQATKDEFASGLAHFLAELNAIHAFREGNGRAQFALVALIAHKAKRPLDTAKLDPERFLEAMIESFSGKDEQLRDEISKML